MNNNQIGRVSLRREWKGLRKFNTCGNLHRSGFEAYPPHLERPWARDDRPDRPDPRIPLLPANKAICFVNDYYSIALDNETDEEEMPPPAPPSWSPAIPRRRTPESSRRYSSGDAHSFPAHLLPDDGHLP